MDRIDTTVIGSTVNIALRLASLAKEFEVPIIVSKAVYGAMSETTRVELTTKELGPVKIRGIDEEIDLIGVTT